MKRVLFGLIALASLALSPASAKAGHWDDDYRGWHRHHRHYRHHHRGDWYGPRPYRRPPVVVYRNDYPPFGYPYGGTSFYYSGPNATFGFGF
jgi:hypothetical protein